MLDLLLAHGADARQEAALMRAIHEHEMAILRSAHGGDRKQVARAETAVRADPSAAFAFDDKGRADLIVGGRAWGAGHFEALSIADLRIRAAARPRGDGKLGRARLWILAGAGAATDIGSLQGHASSGTLFQVASQFNCLESAGPCVRPVEGYFNDSTQGPRAAISAFPGTLLRHYHAPDGQGGRLVQTNDGPQIELLESVCCPGLATVRSGYLLATDILDPAAFAAVLEARFDAIRVGVHDDVDAVLGFDWDGAVAVPPRIGQVFTSTVAGGAYGTFADGLVDVCRPLLRAAYLGTLLAAIGLGRSRVVLTLIGGGAFANPPRLIWESMLWAIAEVEPLLSQDLDVVVNGRNLGLSIERTELAKAARERGGVLLTWPRGGSVSIRR